MAGVAVEWSAGAAWAADPVAPSWSPPTPWAVRSAIEGGRLVGEIENWAGNGALPFDAPPDAGPGGTIALPPPPAGCAAPPPVAGGGAWTRCEKGVVADSTGTAVSGRMEPPPAPGVLSGVAEASAGPDADTIIGGAWMKGTGSARWTGWAVRGVTEGSSMLAESGAIAIDEAMVGMSSAASTAGVRTPRAIEEAPDSGSRRSVRGRNLRLVRCRSLISSPLAQWGCDRG
jgi:hypothetical protein